MSELGSPTEMLDLAGRVIIVTGAGGGLGAGIAKRLDQAGATVVAHSRSTPVSGGFETVMADLATGEGPSSVIEAVLERHGHIDGLINNAGIQPVVPFAELSDEEWTRMIDVDLTAVHRLTHRAATVMADSGRGGSIVHVASIEGHHPTTMHGHYATAKAGLIMHARAAALAFGDRGVRVNSVSPGLIDRPGLAADWPDGVQRWVDAAPLRRLGTPEDVGDACVFLCSDLSRWITGVDLVIDGGVLTNPTW